MLPGPFKYWSTKKRAVDKVRQILPVTPEKKAAVVFALVDSLTKRCATLFSSPPLACEQAFSRAANWGAGKAKRPVDRHLGSTFHGTRLHQILMQAAIGENTDC